MTQEAASPTGPGSGRVDAPLPAAAGRPGGGWFGAAVRSWPLGRRLAAALIGTAIVLLTGVGLITASLVQLNRSIHQRADILSPARLTASQLMINLVDQETGLRGYLLDAQASSLVPYDDGLANQNADLTLLGQLLAGQPSALRDLTALRSAVADWHRVYADPVRTAARRGDVSAARAIDPVGIGKRSFDAIRAADDRLDATLRDRTAAARDRVTAALRQLVALLIIVGVVFASLMAGIATALRAWVTVPLGRIGQDARVVAGGRLDHVVARAGPPDVAELAGHVEDMRLQLVRELGTVWEAAAKLEEQADALRRSNRDLEQFAYVASHDLQEPLRKVASFCQLLERRYGDQLDDRGQQYIDFAVDGAKRMQKLINDLLAFSRVGRTTDAFVPVPLGEALDRATQALATAIEEASAEVTSDPLPTVSGDPTLLAAVFQNLIGNAVKFRGQEAPRIHIGITERDEEWELSCSDNGIGIEADYSEKIFVIFQRLHRRESYEGTGIGLALVRKIVEFHGGTIWLDTETDSGTTFRWTVPRTETTVSTPPPALLTREGAA